jgi:hypothetical protein
MERLRHEGEGILLIFDNAADADALKPYLPPGGSARVLVTSNAPANVPSSMASGTTPSHQLRIPQIARF